jgi:hypothetical protein
LLRTLPPARVTISRVAQEPKAAPALERYFLAIAPPCGWRREIMVTTAQFNRTLIDALSAHIGQTVQLVRSAPFLHRLVLDQLMQAGNADARARVRDMNIDLVEFYRTLLRPYRCCELLETDPVFLLLVVLRANDFF